MGELPRAQAVLLPLLKADSRLDGVKIGSWVEDIDHRTFPMINIRRIGGIRNPKAPRLHMLPVIEMTAYTDTSGPEGLITCEELYETALDVIYDCVAEQRQSPMGSIQSVYETMGSTQFSAYYQDSWRVQGLIRLSLRRPRTTTL